MLADESMENLGMRPFLPVVAGRCQHRLTPFPPSYATEKPCIAVDESSFLRSVPPASPCSPDDRLMHTMQTERESSRNIIRKQQVRDLEGVTRDERGTGMP
jgi:hypothetical protein